MATSLLITIAHPELSSYAPHGWVRLVNYGPAWQLVEIDAEMSCGKDEAPFAWATLHILNGGDADAALAAYTGPLPRFDDLITLAGWHRIYLPLVSRDGDTPSPVTHKQLQE